MLARGGFGDVQAATIIVHGQGSLQVAVKRAVRKGTDVTSGMQQQQLFEGSGKSLSTICR